jgi:hypothetical protein
VLDAVREHFYEVEKTLGIDLDVNFEIRSQRFPLTRRRPKAKQ